MPPSETHQAIETVFRIERARLIAGLTRLVRDVGLAEELAQDALVAALAEWPRTGVPRNPGAWLMAAARRRAIDGFRRDRMRARKHAEIGALAEEADAGVAGIEAALDDEVGDELLGLIFVACHPLLPPPARAALTLRLVGGLTTDEIARAFLATEATIAQRIVRAKKTLREARLAYEVPRGAERDRRLASVLEVVYLIFNEGYAATAGDDLIRPGLCAEARRLGRILARLDPRGARGLRPAGADGAAILAARRPHRAGRRAVPLPEQNRARWDRLLIAAASPPSTAPRRSAAPTAPTRCRRRSPPATPGRGGPRTPTGRGIAGLYDRLRAVMPSPVVELNRAVAHSMAFGPEAGLSLLAAIEPSALPRYAPLPPPGPTSCSAPGRRGRGAGRVRARRGAEPERTRARLPPCARRRLRPLTCGGAPVAP